MSTFITTYCSQCGGEFGPGDQGYSHCVDHAQPGDTLDMAYINSLPQPFMGRTLGREWWPIYDFEVQTGLIRIDVCGKLEVKHIGDFTAFRDGAGIERSAEAFYVDANEDERAAIARATGAKP